ncbi:MAG: hypothetical protein LBL00_04830 [Endomicrobium sp.]|jgi:hypothetical protein|nr:hypothetical protein [Endomicrobium sp.]
MNIKKGLAISICFIMFLPSFAKAVLANDVANLCLNSGIAGYYASVSKAAFDMVNVIFQDFLDMPAQSSKKEVPPKPDNKNTGNDKAVISDNGLQKTFKTNLLPAIPLPFDITKNVYVSKIAQDAHFDFSFWMILLIAMLILSVRKKDGSEVSLNYLTN